MNFLFSKILVAGLFVIAMLSSCGSKQQTSLDPGIPDDYSHLTDIHHFREWGVYNVHDPSVVESDDGYFYMFSTDAIYWPEGAIRESDTIQLGFVQIRRSQDLVNWEFVGWAFDRIPEEALNHVREASGGREPYNLWAPFIKKWGDEYRLYYSASLFGTNYSFIGLAKSNSPMGPFEHVGAVVKTTAIDSPNAIDASVVTDPATNRQWMHYGSFFGGMYVMELNPQTGLPINPGEFGKLIARRAEGDTRIIEAPEVIYNPEKGKWYYFVSYDPLFTRYNIRVGRSTSPEGPFYDFFGNDMAEEENNYPMITHPYRFAGHPGWAGVGHNAIINRDGKFFIMHQGRLAPTNLMMVLHVREVFWTEDGWPVVSPQRYAAVPQTPVRRGEIAGMWEEIRLHEIKDTVTLWQGQIPRGGWRYDTLQFNNSQHLEFLANGRIKEHDHLTWEFDNPHLIVTNSLDGNSNRLILFRGWDWENSRETILYSGLSERGLGIWGKRVD